MNTVDVLIEGYVRELSDTTWEACSTCTLITAQKGKRIIVDPGSNKTLLLAALTKHKLNVEHIDWVFLTHHHLDHAMNVGMFPNAKIIDVEGIYAVDHGEVVGETIPDTEIRIIKTPGHEAGHASLVVPTSKGIVVVAGDVFWWMEGEKQLLDIDKKDAFASDVSSLIESRKTVLAIAYEIIPGHGKRQVVSK